MKKIISTGVVLVVLAGAWFGFQKLQNSSKPYVDRGVEIQDIKVGNGSEAVDSTLITVHYTGRLMDGKIFDRSLERGQPFTFKLGSGQVIAGWEQGIKGMKVGGIRQLKIPSALGYGHRGSPPAIPPDSDLMFEVELLDVK